MSKAGCWIVSVSLVVALSSLAVCGALVSKVNSLNQNLQIVKSDVADIQTNVTTLAGDVSDSNSKNETVQ
jgi:hypothetical protein